MGMFNTAAEFYSMRSSIAALGVAAAMLLFSAPSFADSATRDAPLRLIGKTTLPAIDGDFDHFGVDLQGNRLFLAAEDHHSVELFDLKSGKPLSSITGFDTPHSMVLLLDHNQIYVIDGGDGGAARILDATTYKIKNSIKLTEDADAISYDAAKHLLYVTNGGKEAHNDFSLVTAIDTDKGERVGDFRFPSANLESITLEKNGPLMYVNARDKNQIAVFDRAAGMIKAMWQLKLIQHNTPLILDEADHRLLVAGRKPGRFGAVDSDTGKEVVALPAGDDVDDMAYDPTTRRIYLACGEGFVDVFHQTDADHYEELGRVKTLPGAKTGVLVPELHRYYAVSARKGKVPATLFIFEVPM
jgi:DNA-binding beta-propeller fold protein YncE